MVLIQRRWNADDDRIHPVDFGIVRCCAKAGFLCVLNRVGENPHDIGTTCVQRADFSLFDIEPSDGKAFTAEQQREGQPDIAHSDNADPRLSALNLLFQFREGCYCTRGHVPHCKAVVED